MKNSLEFNRLDKISFLGFSLGGLVIKAALTYLSEYRSYFHSYISLASPHLGCLNSDNKFFSFGIWAIATITANPILKELRMSDDSDIKETALYKLSQTEELQYFKTVLMIGSFQDSYSPVESSLMQMSKRLEGNTNISEMIDNFNENLEQTTVYRVDINFDLKYHTFDEFIGRKAHIQYLENSELMKILISRYSH